MNDRPMKPADLAPSLFLLAHDPMTGRPAVDRPTLAAALLGGVLADLVVAGLLSVDGDGVRDTGRRPPGGWAEPVAHRALEAVAAQDRALSVRAWASHPLAEVIHGLVAEGLVSARVLRREHGRRLLGGPQERYPAVDSVRAARARLEMEQMLDAPRAFDLSGAVVVAIATTTGLDPSWSVEDSLRDDLLAELPDALRALVEGLTGTARARSVVARGSRFTGSRLQVESAAVQRRMQARTPSRGGHTEHAALRARHDAVAGHVEGRRPQDAVPVLEQVVADSAYLLGPGHPDTLTAEGNLAVAYLAADRADVGIPLLVATVEDRERFLGEDHPATLTARDVLASVHRTAGRTAQALALHSDVAVRRSRVLGPGHPDTLTSRLAVGLSLADDGDPRTALSVLGPARRDALAGCGPAHPVTDAIREALASCQAQARALPARADLRRREH